MPLKIAKKREPKSYHSVGITTKNKGEMFLTLPMYKDHISNYSAWKMNLSELIEKYDYPWLDLQYNYNEDVFGPECFENTYKKNQHMTAIGARNASAILSEYILELLY